MENSKLFAEFPPVSTQEWEEVINKDLKGADYDKKLVWKTIEGFNVKPYYRAEDLESLSYLNTNPDEFPYTRGKQPNSNVWDIRQDIKAKDPAEANRIAREAVKGGANSLAFCTKHITDIEALSVLLQGIDLTKVKINFNCSDDFVQLLKLYVQYLDSKNIDKTTVCGSANFDIFKHALKHGDFCGGEEAAYAKATELIDYASENLPKFRVLTVNGNMFQNAGSSIVQELGFTLAAANELMAKLTEKGLKPELVAKNMVFSFAIGSNYFMEMAKIRAARMLWSKIVEQYHPACDCAYKVFVHSTSSVWNKSLYDAYVNMLRTTTETMSVAIAGADSISVAPFDIAYKEADEFSYRIARNQQILLKEESYLDKIADPAAGSYYIENLTDSIAQHAWNIFLRVEEKGGFGVAIRDSFVQDEIEKTATQRNNDIAMRKTVILGTNQYPNLNDDMNGKITKEKCCCCCKSAEGPIKPLRQYRGAEAFEELRLATERSGRKPKVFMLTYGNVAMRRARSGFATNFFGVVGYEIIDNVGFATAQEGVEAALKANADIVVLCSSDDEYAEIVADACNGLKGKVKSIVLAGFPKEQIETFKAAGIDEFIHIKTNALECLTSFQKLLGLM